MTVNGWRTIGKSMEVSNKSEGEMEVGGKGGMSHKRVDSDAKFNHLY